MAKRLRQANLFETLAKKRATDEIEPSSLLEELPVSGELCHDESDDSEAEEELVEHEADLSREAVIESSVCEVLPGCGQSSDCQSLCCADETKAYQPTNAQTLLSLANGGRNFQARWYGAFSWITLCTNKKKAFCFYCRLAECKGILSFSTKAEPTFSTRGFNIWRKALEKSKHHDASNAHAEAVMKWQMLHSAPINAQLQTQVQKLQQSRRHALVKQLYCLRYLLRQGLTVRGHKEIEGNLYQLLVMVSAYDSEMSTWLREKKYISPSIVNEQISIMGLAILRTLLDSIKSSSPPWYALIADEATDVANHEQLNLSIRWVSDDYEISEDPVGLYVLPNTKAETLYFVITDILTRCSLPLDMCRGQAYDGASTMQGVRSGLATRIKHDNPAALSVHCLAHCLNLCLQEEGRKLPFIRDALDLVREIAKLIAFSPKRAHLLSQNLSQSDTQGVNIKPLCPTRWTARTGAIGAILTDYPVLMETLDEVRQTTKDEYGLKAAGLLSGMEKFSMLFGLKLGYLMFGASETLSKSLQGKDTTIQEAIGAANLAKGFYKRQRTDQAFESFYTDVLDTARKHEIGDP